MNVKFNLLGNARTGRPRAGLRILDLGAAPGSWSLYTLRKIKANGFLLAADMAPLSRHYDQGLFDQENFLFVQGDITDPAVKGAILSRGPYSLLLSDAAPATTGNRSTDPARSLELADAVITYAESGLEAGGSLVVKVFPGGVTSSVLLKIRELFVTGKGFKPAACRSESFETYYVGIGKKSGGLPDIKSDALSASSST
jgi:23S rRNA (uridine2552-2'-O)-methyltransferase